MKNILVIAFVVLTASSSLRAEENILRVCADPNNLPFSNKFEEGFENKIVDLIAAELKSKVEYTWWAQRRGFERNTLGAEKCDLWPGIASTSEGITVTRPYYRSTYVFLSRADRHLNINSYDDSRLADLIIGVQMIGDDGANTPPAHALTSQGHINNIRGYMLYGDYEEKNPSSTIIEAVARGEVDLAIVWGPLAGYFADISPVKLITIPVNPMLDNSPWNMAFDISMGVQQGNEKLRAQLNKILTQKNDRIHEILSSYNVLLVEKKDKK
ncbi:quinoprotein dehydrogenase-associated putative ABC transporter substrate-binding protein [Methylophaga sp. UBA2689]|jgi:mxaJ protein|uniref:quinoprotein dehydrogenase-associated putative ABC transporter substrate-binding protein n=1 Tax=Methylophaga sp. UBA2689 TaxID=1946878 RepID=UPI0025D2783F|nr:quinoprotein dehydrogenase-associated putative ABC transporter substrate-binding protein [Methylophaga sp. UBA2689]|tara:strand:- start:2650 stop:3459 length:810 start_codon:yes stop_codon:yes gene_type:complete